MIWNLHLLLQWAAGQIKRNYSINWVSRSMWCAASSWNHIHTHIHNGRSKRNDGEIVIKSSCLFVWAGTRSIFGSKWHLKSSETKANKTRVTERKSSQNGFKSVAAVHVKGHYEFLWRQLQQLDRQIYATILGTYTLSTRPRSTFFLKCRMAGGVYVCLGNCKYRHLNW